MKLNFDVSSWSRATKSVRLGINEPYTKAQISAFTKEKSAVWLFIWDMAREITVIKHTAPEFVQTLPWLKDDFSIDLIEESIQVKNLGGGIDEAITQDTLSPFKADLLIRHLQPVLVWFQKFMTQKKNEDDREKAVNQIARRTFDKLKTVEVVVLEAWFRAKREDPFFTRRMGTDKELLVSSFTPAEHTLLDKLL